MREMPDFARENIDNESLYRRKYLDSDAFALCMAESVIQFLRLAINDHPSSDRWQQTAKSSTPCMAGYAALLRISLAV